MKNIDNVLKAIKELYKGGSTDDPPTQEYTE
jgi:hypothetical protein